MTAPAPPVIIGFDGSAGARDAAVLAGVLAEPGAPVLAASVGNSGSREAVARLLPGRSVEVRRAVAVSAARGLRELAESEGAELIVVGSPHRGRLGRVVMGSVASELAKGAPCPVAIAPHGYADTAHGQIRAIAVGYDGSREARQALIAAEAIALRTGSLLRLVDAIRVPPEGVLSVYNQALHWQADQRLAEARRAITANLGELAGDLSVETAVVEGEAAQVLVTEGVEIDLLVVGSRHRGALVGSVAGSVSAAVISNSPCPVMVVATTS